jgi:8-oxo-dGTP pyrophosphatase MutT (NUDIX family)
VSDPVRRTAARVLLLDQEHRVLLFLGSDPADRAAGNWWITPGGGVEPGETLMQAARREVQEETGLLLPADLGSVVLEQTSRFSFDGVLYEQTDHFFVATVENTRIDYSGWSDTERRAVQRHRWWTADELHRTDESFHPSDLLDVLTRL